MNTAETVVDFIVRKGGRFQARRLSFERSEHRARRLQDVIRSQVTHAVDLSFDVQIRLDNHALICGILFLLLL